MSYLQIVQKGIIHVPTLQYTGIVPINTLSKFPRNKFHKYVKIEFSPRYRLKMTRHDAIHT